MQCDRRVEIGFLQLRLDRDRCDLEQFGRVRADHVHPDHFVGRLVDHQFV